MPDITESIVNDVLAHPFDHKWTVQGFGMLRTYLDDDEIHRLHIWNVDAAVPDVSVIHDHPWDFDSRIYRGSILNQRYLLDTPTGVAVRTAKIKTGEGGGLISQDNRLALLSALPREDYGPGQTYHMDAPELHESIPVPGTVSVISRRFHTSRDNQFATVCWQTDEWISAEPRPATHDEILHYISLAKIHAGQ